jgi:hypothetical protein
MGLTKFTTEQLEFLSGDAYRLDAVVGSACAPITRLLQPGFETIEACQAEDRNRAGALRALASKQRAGTRRKSAPKPQADALPGDPSELAAALEAIADPVSSKPAQACLASAVYMYHRRIGMLGSILKLVRQHAELDVGWVTATDSGLHYDQNQGWSEVCRIARQRLEHQLAFSGALTAPGFLIAYLQGYFDARVAKFLLRYQGIVAGDKLMCIRGRTNQRVNNGRPQVGLKLNVHQVRDLRQQISDMMPNSLPELGLSPTGEITSVTRMREPYHSIYLMWLAQHSLSDFLAMNGAFYWDGRLAMNECYGAAAGRGTPRRRSKSAPPVFAHQAGHSANGSRHVRHSRNFPGM